MEESVRGWLFVVEEMYLLSHVLPTSDFSPFHPSSFPPFISILYIHLLWQIFQKAKWRKQNQIIQIGKGNISIGLAEEKNLPYYGTTTRILKMKNILSKYCRYYSYSFLLFTPLASFLLKFFLLTSQRLFSNFNFYFRRLSNYQTPHLTPTNKLNRLPRLLAKLLCCLVMRKSLAQMS